MPKFLTPLALAIQAEKNARRGRHFAESATVETGGLPDGGALLDYFREHTDGPGIWKWEHYFPIYERHFAKFGGRPVNVLEIGIYSGGSLPMWRHYFGDQCHVYGIDIEAACKAYESENVSVFIGDQGSRDFWKSLKLPPIDIVIDDGAHMLEQMIVTLEETFPLMSAESVYICEDVHGQDNSFTDYVHGLVKSLNTMKQVEGDAALNAETSGFQRAVNSIHSYPFCVVVERGGYSKFRSPMQGTKWQPFYD